MGGRRAGVGTAQLDGAVSHDQHVMSASSRRAGHVSAGRALARELVSQARVRNAYMRALVDARRESCKGMAKRDVDFAQVLAFGVTMCSGTLDELIDRNIRSPRDVRAKLRDCLRISAYELLFLGKAPHVAVSQGVELAASVEPRARGLANAVLRGMARDAQTFPWGDVAHDMDAFARSYGVPRWLAEALVAQYGRERAASVLAACLEPAPTYLAQCPTAPDEPFACDLSAQQCAALVPLAGPVLEVGAGRGTKTLLLQSRSLRERGCCTPIHTIDVHAHKQRVLEQRVRALGIADVHAHTADARELDTVEGLPAQFASVLVDAPCSGTGTLRRHPEIRWRLQPEDVRALCELQYELLVAAAGRVRPHGTLVYATCSLLEAENEALVTRFAASESGTVFERDPITADELLSGQPRSALSPQGCFASLPSSGGPDGHFAVRFRRIS